MVTIKMHKLSLKSLFLAFFADDRTEKNSGGQAIPLAWKCN